MAEFITRLSDIAARYRLLYADLWGCVHDGHRAYPAAVAALRTFRAGGGRVVLLTNAPRPSVVVTAQFGRLAIPDDAYDLVVSSGDAAQVALFSGAVGRRVHHLGPDKDAGLFTAIPAEFRHAPPITRVGLDEAEGIVCTGLVDDGTETPEDYRASLLLARTRGLTMLCANPDLVVDMGAERLFCAGALAQAYEQAGGEVLYFGKPHPPIYDLARRRLAAVTGEDIDSQAILAIGDGIGTDIQGGLGEGIDTWFLTGGISAAEFGPDRGNPDRARVAAWLEALQIAPSYIGPYLR